MRTSRPLASASAVLTALFLAASAPATGAWASSAPATEAGVAHPSWAKDLGPGAVVYAPASVAPGHGSAAAPVQGLVDALNDGKPVQACQYYQPSFQSSCRKSLSQMKASEIPTVKHFAIGYAVVVGKKGLVGQTGTFCVPGESPLCVTNSHPDAIFVTGKTFQKLWAETLSSGNSSANIYSLAPVEEISGHWYDYVPPN